MPMRGRGKLGLAIVALLVLAQGSAACGSGRSFAAACPCWPESFDSRACRHRSSSPGTLSASRRCRGGSREDVARATGFLHAQDRFFQMDLARRRAAGELRRWWAHARSWPTVRSASIAFAPKRDERSRRWIPTGGHADAYSAA